MRKIEFLYELDAKLAMLPEEDRARSIEYYSEIIDDRIEDGIPEEKAVAYLGSIDDIVAQIVSETPLPKLIKTKFKKKDNTSSKIWEIILIVFGFLVFGIPVIAAVFSVAISIYASLWAVVIVLFAVSVALFGGGIIAIIAFFPIIAMGYIPNAFIALGAGFISLGLVLPFFYIAKFSAIGAVLVSKGIILAIKKSFIKKEG